MKIKCYDGIVREFKVPKVHQDFEALCLHCGEQFGCHDTKILKPKFKAHICTLPLLDASKK